MNKKSRYIFFLILLFISINLFSAPYNGEVFKFEQPDGSLVEVKIFGDEFYSRCESLDGYTLVRDESTGWICYAELLEENGELVSTGIKYTGKNTNGSFLKSGVNLAKHQDISASKRNSIIDSNRKQLLTEEASGLKSVSAVNAVQGHYKGITIVVDFSDNEGVHEMSLIKEMLNGDNFTTNGNNGSVKQFYNEISNGLVTYENEVFGWFRAPKTFAEYDAMDYGTGAREILKLALNWVNDSLDFDFSTLTTNSNNKILAINLMYTGHPKGWSKGMWYHKGNFSNFSADGVSAKTYNCSPANSGLKISTICHENGHMLCGWPDTYKYSGAEDGIGGWDLMCTSGSKNPPPPNPHFRNLAGWGNEVLIGEKDTTLVSVSNDFNIYKYVNPNDPKEFFLIESRLKEGRNGGIPGSGLTIWHIDRNGWHQADNIEDQVVYIEHSYNAVTTHNIAPYRSDLVSEFSSKTSPSPKWHSGEESGLRIYDVSAIGDSMTFKVSFEPTDMLEKENWEIINSQYISVSKAISRTIDKTPYYSFICQASPSTPFEMEIDLGASYDLTKLQYLPRYSKGGNSIKTYTIFVSDNSTEWDSITSGNWVQDNKLKTSTFNANGRYIKLRGLSNESNQQTLNMAELYLFGEINPSSSPNSAYSPSPVDGAVQILANGTLSWTPGDGAMSHQVYLSEDDSIDAEDYLGEKIEDLLSFSDLKEGHKYYWRVDEVNENGVTTGKLWSFLTKAENLALNKPIVSSSNYNTSYVANKANDGDNSTNNSRWVSGDGSYPITLEIDLEASSTVTGIGLYTGWDGYNKPINDFKLQYLDGEEWLDIMSEEGNTESVYSKTFDPVVVQNKVRLYITKTTEDRVRLYEIEILGSKNTATSTNKLLEYKELTVYPNPTQDNVILKGLDKSELVRIYSMSGILVKQIEAKNIVNASDLKNGLYLLKIDGYHPVRIIKE